MQIFVERDFSHITPAFDAPVSGVYPLEFAMTFGTEKTRMVWLHEGEKILKIMFIRFDSIHERDGRTEVSICRSDRSTPHDGWPRLHSIARQI